MASPRRRTRRECRGGQTLRAPARRWSPAGNGSLATLPGSGLAGRELACNFQLASLLLYQDSLAAPWAEGTDAPVRTFEPPGVVDDALDLAHPVGEIGLGRVHQQRVVRGVRQSACPVRLKRTCTPGRAARNIRQSIDILAPVAASGEVVKPAGLRQPKGSCQAPTDEQNRGKQVRPDPDFPLRAPRSRRGSNHRHSASTEIPLSGSNLRLTTCDSDSPP